jgi:hypothetical protein
LPLRVGEFFVSAQGSYGNYVDALSMLTNFDRMHFWGGGGGTLDFQCSAGESEEIIGFFGRAQTYLDAIGFVIRRRA